MANNSFKEISEVLKAAGSVLIFPHINLDGDAVGCAAALCRALRKLGKKAHILIEDPVPANLMCIEGGMTTFDMDIIENPDVCLCVDCGDFSRFPLRKEKFLEGKTTVCIDHHRTTEKFCDYNYIDPDAAASGELIFALLEELGAGIDVEMGEAIFAAITTDTGKYQYSNTTRESHLITARLMELGVDTNKVSVEIYENERFEKIMTGARVLSNVRMIGGGKAAVAGISLKELEEIGARPEETEGVVEKIRSIAGVEYSAFLKEKTPGVIRVSMRAKRLGDVAKIAARYGGGGHIKAAGCTLEMTLEEAMALISRELEEAAAEL